jgi:ABC-2 type transport system permease protein
MSTTTNKFSENLRIVWAIAAKDITDAIKNKITLGVILPALFMVVFYRYMPTLTNGDDLPNALVYDAGGSSLVAALDNSAALNLYEYPSQEKMESYLANGDVPELGLVIPPDFDQAREAGGPLEIEGYVLHWVSESDANELRTLVEQEITELAGRPVSIDIEGNTVYPRPDSRGYPFLTSMALIYVTTMIGMTLVPNLMIEEKQTKTLDALLVSPASAGQVVIGKALTGLFYCLIVTGIVFALNQALVANWGLALLAAICGSAFGVALGLLLGSTLEVKQQLQLWAWILILPLLLPVFLSLMDDILPAGVITVFHWIPTVALAKVFRVSFSNSAPLAQFGPELALVAGCAALVLAAVAWVVRCSDK